MTSKRKIVCFDISLTFIDQTIHLRFKNYSLDNLIDVDDEDYIVDDLSRPKVKFNDIIGATSAKEELKFFIDYLKHPKH